MNRAQIELWLIEYRLIFFLVPIFWANIWAMWKYLTPIRSPKCPNSQQSLFFLVWNPTNKQIFFFYNSLQPGEKGTLDWK